MPSELTIFDGAIRQQVLYKMGVAPDGSTPVRVRAPFDVVMMKAAPGADVLKSTLVMPRPFMHRDVGDSWAKALDQLIGTATPWTDNLNAYNELDGGIGFMTGESIIVDESQMGAMTDNWLGVHKFSLL